MAKLSLRISVPDSKRMAILTMSFLTCQPVPSCSELCVLSPLPWAAIQRRDSILAWMLILSVYGADTIAIDLSLSALIS
jgi:hypothetical protein